MTMDGTMVAIELLELALKAGGGIVELITEKERASLEERIARARAGIKDPADTSADDASRRAELERILRGGTVSIVVNGRTVDAPVRLTYEHAVSLAGLQGTPTVTFRRSLDGVGELRPGQHVRVKAGTVIDATHTSRA